MVDFPPYRSSSPACVKIDFSRSGETSSFSRCPEIVTRPGFVGCLNCRCDPFCAMSFQPSALMMRKRSRTFRGITAPPYIILHVVCTCTGKIWPKFFASFRCVLPKSTTAFIFLHIMPYKFIKCKIGRRSRCQQCENKKKLLQEDISSFCSSQLPTGANT